MGAGFEISQDLFRKTNTSSSIHSRGNLKQGIGSMVERDAEG